MSIEHIVYKYISKDGEYDQQDISEIFENNEDIEIALEIFENEDCEKYSISDIEREIAYMRKNRLYSIVE